MKKYLAGLLIGLLLSVLAYSEKITVKGQATGYAGDAIVLKTFADHITKAEKVLARTEVDSTGRFRIVFNSEHPVYSFTDLGVYRAYIILVPGKTYTISLPPYKPLTSQQEKDPFFRRKAVYLKIQHPDSTDTNVRINQFDYAYNGFLSNVSMRKFKRKSLQDVDSVIDALNRKFPSKGNTYFNTHKYYRFAYLKNIIFDRNPKESLRKDFKNQPVAFTHPVYNEVFGSVAADYVKNIITQGKLDMPYTEFYTVKGLMHHVNSLPLFSRDSLRELFILHALYEGYHEEYFHYKSVKYVTDSLNQHGVAPYIRHTAQRIKKQVLDLRKGYPAPGFSLPDQDSIIADLSLFRGKFILLHFFSSDNYTAIKEMPLLKKLHEKYNRNLAIVTISADKDFSRVLKLARKYNCEWTFLHYQPESDVLKKYNVVTYPTYHLLSPTGKIVMAPAPKPEKLMNKLAKLIVKERRKRLRKQHKKGGEDNTKSPY